MARGTYSGLSPSASNCRLHSVGGSRSRSTPMPRGRRPSTAALTRLGARKAREMVILTCRTLHFSRPQSSATVVIGARKSVCHDGGCVLWSQRWLCPGQLSLVPRHSLGRGGHIDSILHG